MPAKFASPSPLSFSRSVSLSLPLSPQAHRRKTWQSTPLALALFLPSRPGERRCGAGVPESELRLLGDVSVEVRRIGSRSRSNVAHVSSCDSGTAESVDSGKTRARGWETKAAAVQTQGEARTGVRGKVVVSWERDKGAVCGCVLGIASSTAIKAMRGKCRAEQERSLKRTHTLRRPKGSLRQGLSPALREAAAEDRARGGRGARGIPAPTLPGDRSMPNRGRGGCRGRGNKTNKAEGLRQAPTSATFVLAFASLLAARRPRQRV